MWLLRRLTHSLPLLLLAVALFGNSGTYPPSAGLIHGLPPDPGSIASIGLTPASAQPVSAPTACAGPPARILTHLTGDPVIKMDSPSCVIPFTRAGNLILIKAKVDSIDGNFILDTGAPNLVLNMTYFRHYPSRFTEGEEGGITGSVNGQNGTVVRTLASKSAAAAA